MTALRRWLRNYLERWLGRYYEGPEPPPRLVQEVRLFAALHPHASPAEWKDFAARLAQNSYRDGFIRGEEWNERMWPGPSTEPELLAEAAPYNWSYPEERLLQLERAPSPIVGMTAAQAAELQHQLAHVGARLVLAEPNRPYPRRR